MTSCVPMLSVSVSLSLSRSLLGDLNNHESILELAVSQESNPQPLSSPNHQSSPAPLHESGDLP